MPMSLQRYFDVSQAGDAQTLRTRLVEHTHELGFAFVAAVMVHEDAGTGEGPLIVALGNAPEDSEATEALSVEDSLRDPVLRRLRHMSVPFAWDQDTYTREGAGDLWERQAAHGFRTGVAVALLLLLTPLHYAFAILLGALVFAGVYAVVLRQVMLKINVAVETAQKDLAANRIEKAIRLIEEVQKKYAPWQFYIRQQMNSQIGSIYYLKRDFSKARPSGPSTCFTINGPVGLLETA